MSAADDDDLIGSRRDDSEPDDRTAGLDRHVDGIKDQWAAQRKAQTAGQRFADELLAQEEDIRQHALYVIAGNDPKCYRKAEYGPHRDSLLIEERVDRLRVDYVARQQFDRELRGPDESGVHMVAGGSFIHDLPAEMPSIWGTGNAVVWAGGEALILVGTPGVGKTTIAGQLLRARLVGGEVLGMEVAKAEGRVLYLAMDRPQQIARALARRLRDVPRDVLDARLTFWPGPPEEDFAVNPEKMLQMAREVDADTVVVDSLKDAALGLSNDEVGAGYNRARQFCLANGVELLELHHMKKQGGSGSGKATRPTKLEDVYGSAWLTAGAGSVVILIGEAGDPVVEWRHLKQPAEPVGPLIIEHDHIAGTSAIYDGTDPYELVRKAGDAGITARAFSEKWLGHGDPSTQDGKNAIAKAHRKLKAWVRTGVVEIVVVGDKTTNTAARYAARLRSLDGPEDVFSPIDEDDDGFSLV